MATAATPEPAFSVVVPAYNAAATIARALDSVLAQAHPALEVVVVDDGSADDTAAVVLAHEASRRGLARLVRQANAGPSAARNAGVAAARGDWIAFLDADDWFLPQRLQVHAGMLAADPGLDFLVGGFDRIAPGGRLLGRSLDESACGRRLLREHGAGARVVLDGSAIGEFIGQQFSDTRSLSLPRRRFLDLGGFPLALRICEDLVFMLRLAAASRRAGAACESLSAYLVHDAGLIRADRLRSQTESVRALKTLAGPMQQAPAPVRAAWQRLLKDAHRDLAYHLAKLGRRGDALAGLAASFRFRPAWRDGRDLLSLLKG